MSSKFWAYILLIAFGVLLTPRTVWHDCHHDDEHMEVSDNHTHLEKKCYACDYDMDAALEPVSFRLAVIPPDYYTQQEVVEHLVDLFRVDDDFLRGPPAC